MQKLDDLIVFTRVVERGSFIGAARQLGLPAATVSRKVQDLEARLGIELLRRTTRRVFVTEAGREVYDKAARGLALIDEAELVAKSHIGRPAGVLRVLAPFSVGVLTLNPILPLFQQRHPDVLVDLTLDNHALDLIEHGFDIALRFGTLPDSAYMARRLYTGQRIIVAAPDYLAKADPPLRTLSDLPRFDYFALVHDQSTQHLLNFKRGVERETIQLSPKMTTNEGSIILDQILHGRGYAILSEVLCRTAIASGMLEVVLPDWQLADSAELSILFVRQATSDPKIRLFIDFLIQTMRVPNIDHSNWPDEAVGGTPSLILPSAPVSVLASVRPAAE